MIFHENLQNPMIFHDFSAQDGSENDPKLPQDQSKTVPKAVIFYVEFWLQFWTVLGSVLAPCWDPFGLQHRSKTGPKIHQKSSCSNMPPQDRPERPQDLSRPHQDRPKSAQDHPKSYPNSPKRPQNHPKEASRSPQEPQRSSQSNLSSIVLDNFYFPTKHTCCKLDRSNQEDPRSCQDQNIRSSELLSLYASEPSGLRVPAGSCLGGICEAQKKNISQQKTITEGVFIHCSYSCS